MPLQSISGIDFPCHLTMFLKKEHYMKIDHNSLRFFLEQKQLQERQQKWVSKIQAYDFDIEYVKGKKNVVVDALSRKPIACTLVELIEDLKAYLFAKYAKNQFACALVDKII